MLNIAAQQNISAAQTQVLFRSKKTKKVGGKKPASSVIVQNMCKI